MKIRILLSKVEVKQKTKTKVRLNSLFNVVGKRKWNSEFPIFQILFSHVVGK